MKSFSDIFKTLVLETKRDLWTMGLHAFSLILFFVFIDFILGGMVFYKYVFLAETQEPNAIEGVLKFDDKTYKKIMTELTAKEQENQGSSVIGQPKTLEDTQKNLAD